MSFPDDVICIILNNIPDKLNFRAVNKSFCTASDIFMKNYESDLCNMLSACRISVSNVPKKWLMRYVHCYNNSMLQQTYICYSCGSSISEIGNCSKCITNRMDSHLKMFIELSLIVWTCITITCSYNVYIDIEYNLNNQQDKIG